MRFVFLRIAGDEQPETKHNFFFVLKFCCLLADVIKLFSIVILTCLTLEILFHQSLMYMKYQTVVQKGRSTWVGSFLL